MLCIAKPGMNHFSIYTTRYCVVFLTFLQRNSTNTLVFFIRKDFTILTAG